MKRVNVFKNYKKYLLVVFLVVLLFLVFKTTKSSYAGGSYTKGDLQNMVVSTALSYANNASYSDYDQTSMDPTAGTFKKTYYYRNLNVSPESVSRTNKYFIDCSSFVFSVYMQSLGFDFSDYYSVIKSGANSGDTYDTRYYYNGAWNSITKQDQFKWSYEKYNGRVMSTTTLIKISEHLLKESGVSAPQAGKFYEPSNSLLRFYYAVPSLTDSQRKTTIQTDVVNKLKKVVQAGDIIIVKSDTDSGHGHVVIYAGSSQIKGIEYADIEATGYSQDQYGTRSDAYGTGKDAYSVRIRSFIYRAGLDNAFLRRGTGTRIAILRPINYYCDSSATTSTVCNINPDMYKAEQSLARGYLSKVKKEQYATDSNNKTIGEHNSISDHDIIRYHLKLSSISSLSFCDSTSAYTTQSACNKAGFEWRTATSNFASSAISSITAEIPGNLSNVKCESNNCTIKDNKITWSNLGFIDYNFEGIITSGTQVDFTGFKIELANGKELNMGSINTKVSSAIRNTFDKTVFNSHKNDFVSSTPWVVWNDAYDMSDLLKITPSDVYNAVFKVARNGTSDFTIDLSNTSGEKNALINKMLVPGVWGGVLFRGNDNWDGNYRVKYLTESDFELGDLIFSYNSSGGNFKTGMYAGNHEFYYYVDNEKYLNTYDPYQKKNLTDLTDYVVRGYLKRSLFVVLRPSNLLTNVKLDLQGGTGSDSSFLAYKTYKNVDNITIPTKEGYEFDGWYTAKEGGVKVDSNTNLTSNVLYAKWKPRIEIENERTSLSYTEEAINQFDYNGDGDLSCSSSNEEFVICEVDVENGQIIVKPIKAESGEVVITVAAGEGIQSTSAKSKSFVVTVKEVTPVVSLDKKDSTYTGEVVTANTATVSPDRGADITYKYYTDSNCSVETTSSAGAEFDGGAPVDAGNYYVKAFVAATKTTNEASSGCVPHTIAPKGIDISWGSTTSFTYNNSSHAPTVGATTGIQGEEIKLSRTGKTAAGNYTSTARCTSVTGGRANCANYVLNNPTMSFSIAKAKNTLTLSYATKTVYYSKVKKSSQVVKPITVSKWNGTVTYVKESGSSNLTVNKTTGKITVKKGTKKGTYKVKIKVNAAGNSNYLSGYKIITTTTKIK